MSDADTLVSLANLAATRHDQRRQYEWKVSFAFWATLIGVIVKNPPIPINMKNGIPWICAGIFLLYAFTWIRGVWKANYNDKTLSDYFRDQAVKKLRNPGATLDEKPARLTWKARKYWDGIFGDWSMVFHLLVTAILLVVFYLTSI